MLYWCSGFGFFINLGLSTLSVLYSEIQLPVLAMSYLGVLLLVASQVTFVIFISATTVNQLLAFLFTLLGLFFLFILAS